ncbi:SnoaL-like protein [Solirubrobacter pauli]|uniref:SnoaL-like protein n=1 Tax=Solirubrobacter pauli TaxID=166793 RepID=A0A660LGC0_9ACTN|nr:nuclear transport factor 2 family protein [Solirubrobacter pauli]RKQ93225.1 SnoaL-like protein [Solirubrobacter pauli]
MLPTTRTAVRPWSVAGGPDEGVSDSERCAHCRALTAANLIGAYRRRFPDDARADYDWIIRRMGHVWDCPRDGAANVVGYRCARCGDAQPGRLARSKRVAYVRRLCSAFTTGGVDALASIVPADVEWIPQLAGGQVLHGSEELQAFFAERRSPLRVPPPARIEAVGTDVLVRFRSPPGAPPLWSVYQFETGRLFRAVSFDNEAEAVRQTG